VKIVTVDVTHITMTVMIMIIVVLFSVYDHQSQLALLIGYKWWIVTVDVIRFDMCIFFPLSSLSADDMGLLTSADLLLLKDRATIKSR